MGRRPPGLSVRLLLASEILIQCFGAEVSSGAVAPNRASEGESPLSAPLPADENSLIFSPGLIVGPGTADGATVPTTSLILAVTVNGMDKGLHQFAEIGDELWTDVQTLVNIGIGSPPGVTGAVSLTRMAGVSVNYNVSEQRVALIVQPHLLTGPATILNAGYRERPVTQKAAGFLFNYDVSANIYRGDTSLSALTGLRYFNGNHVLESTAILRTDSGRGYGGEGVTRLDSRWSYSIPEKRFTVTLGDTLTAPSRWTRTTRMGGIQFGTNNRLQPYLVTAPLPSFIGSATLPSKVDLLVNGIRRFQGDVPAGPFDLSLGATRINGAGNAQVVLTDVSGRITTLDFSIYDTPLLLRQGLADWSVEAGTVREDYGLRSFAYDDDIFGSANIRYGLTNWFTAEAHGEVANGYGNGGAGGALLLGSLGVLSGAAAVSRSHGRTGHVLQGGYSWTNGIIRIGGEIARASRDYTDLAGRHGADYPRERDVAYAGYTNPRLGSFSLNYVNQRYPGNDRFRYVALGWQKPLSRQWWVRLRAQRELAGEKRTGFLVTLSWAPGNGTNFGASVQTDDRRTIGNVYARRSAPLEGGIGWYANGWTDGDEAGGFGQIDYRSAHGEGTLGATVRDDTVSGFAAWRGSMVFMDGGLYAARPIQDSFALVSTSGVEDVPILLYNREFGRTNAEGRLLVTGLNAYQRNDLAIDTTNLPPTMSVTTTQQQAVPADRAGVRLEFDIRQSRAMLVTLTDRRGGPVPVGTQARYADTPSSLFVAGFDGQIFIEDARPGALLDVMLPDGRCTVRLPSHLPPDRAGRTGTLTCQ